MKILAGEAGGATDDYCSQFLLRLLKAVKFSLNKRVVASDYQGWCNSEVVPPRSRPLAVLRSARLDLSEGQPPKPTEGDVRALRKRTSEPYGRVMFDSTWARLIHTRLHCPRQHPANIKISAHQDCVQLEFSGLFPRAAMLTTRLSSVKRLIWDDHDDHLCLFSKGTRAHRLLLPFKKILISRLGLFLPYLKDTDISLSHFTLRLSYSTSATKLLIEII